MRVEIVKLGINGEGIGYLDNKPLFVPGAFPTEIVEVSNIKRHGTDTTVCFYYIILF